MGLGRVVGGGGWEGDLQRRGGCGYEEEGEPARWRGVSNW